MLRLGMAFALIFGATNTVMAVPQRFVVTNDPNAPEAVVMSYDPTDGMLAVTSNEIVMTAFQLESDNLLFNSLMLHPDFACPGFSICQFDRKIFVLYTSGVTQLSIGPILPPSMNADRLLGDLWVDGALLPPSSFAEAPGGGPYLYIVPEPSSATLLLIGAVVFCRCRANYWKDFSYDMS